MALPQLPISSLINVAVSLTQTAAQAQSLNTMLILVNTDRIDPVERYRVFNSYEEVAAQITGGSGPTAAQAYFSQTPAPRQLILGLWAKSAKPGGLRGATIPRSGQNMEVWNLITSGGFGIVVNNNPLVNLTGLNFAAATSMADVATIIQAGLDAATIPVTITWEEALARFWLRGPGQGVNSNVAFLVAPSTGTNISDDMKCRVNDTGAYSYYGVEFEPPNSIIPLFDELIGQKWYGVAFSNDDDLDVTPALQLAASVEASANKHAYIYTTSDAACLLAASTTDAAATFKARGYSRSYLQYSADAPQAGISAWARLITTNYAASGTAITLMFKQQPGLLAENLTASQAQALKDKNCNVFVAYDNDTSILQHGTMVNGTFADILTGTDWLATTIQTELWNLFYTTTTKIPQTDAGVNLLVTKVERICNQAVNNGLLAPGVWNGPIFGALGAGDYLAKGFYVFAGRVDDQTQADRAARKAPPIQVAAKLAGAIHSVDLSITVNQ